MTQQIINIGAAPNDGTGDAVRSSFDKCNLNFTELYAGVAKGVSIGPAIEYQFNNTTTEPPASGQIRFNQATQASTTKLWASHTTSSGINIKQFLSAATTGAKLILQDENDNTNYIKFDVTGVPVDKTTYWEFAVAVTASGGNLPNAAILAAVTAATGGGGGGGFTASSTAPVAPNAGDHWYDLSTGVLSIYVNDGTSSQWVMVAPAGGGGTDSTPPQGRLTLQANTPVMTTTQAAKTTLFYSGYIGNKAPIYDGASMSMMSFAGDISVLTTDTTQNPAAIGANKVNDWFIWFGGGSLRLTHGPDWTSDTARSAGTALVMVNGIWLNNVSITNGPAASRGTYVGTTRSNASSQLDWILGAAASGGIAAFLNVWNCYNRVTVSTNVSDNGASYTYSPSTIRQARASAGNQINFVLGLQEDGVQANFVTQAITASVTAAWLYWGISLDSTTTFGTQPCRIWSAVTGQFISSAPCYGTFSPGIGNHFIAATEAGDGTNGNTLCGTSLQVLSATLRM